MVKPVRSSSPGASRATIAIDRAAEISGNGMIAKNSFIHSTQRGSTLRNIDAKAFQALSEHHGSDGTYVYHRGERIDGADPSTFKVLNYWFGKDRSSVFGGPKKYPACDVATFQVLKKGWSRDAKCVFAPEGVVPELDAATFEPYSQACGKDKFGYFNRFGRKRSDGPKDC